MTEPDPRWDDEGIPDIADDATPERTRYPEPQEQPLPGERPQAVTDFGTTADEQRQGESLDGRLAREEPDLPPDAGAAGADDTADGADPAAPGPDDAGSASADWDAPGRLVEPDEGTHPDTEKDLVASEAHGEAGLSPEERALHLEE